MNETVLEQLLNEDESATLDFKRDQYPFVGATDEQKSELLKDILAFANAWRRTTAFILIGVQEVKGGRSNVVGVASHLNDNELQQFVNGKTNRPVHFSYSTHPIEGKSIGIIEIAPQDRPVFLQRDFGRLKAGAVYLRRSSSTAVADPTEIARMGAADSESRPAIPGFEVEWADIGAQRAQGQAIMLRSTSLHPRLRVETFLPRQTGLAIMPLSFGNEESYYRELIDYVFDGFFLSPVGFVIRNTGAAAAQNAVAHCRLDKVPGVRIVDFRKRPIQPPRFRPLIPMAQAPSAARPDDPDPRIREYPTHWDLTIPLGKISPKASMWSTESIWIGSEQSLSLAFPIDIFADNLPAPQRFTLTVQLEADARPMSRADFPANSAH